MYKDRVLQKNCFHNLTYDTPGDVAEDHRTAFLKSNIFWQVGCARSKTKACTEISSWTIYKKKSFFDPILKLSEQDSKINWVSASLASGVYGLFIGRG